MVCEFQAKTQGLVVELSVNDTEIPEYCGKHSAQISQEAAEGLGEIGDALALVNSLK